VAKGAIGGGVWETDDCRAIYEELGIEAVYRDDSGNWFGLTRRTRAKPCASGRR
jgi:hypothetical protein